MDELTISNLYIEDEDGKIIGELGVVDGEGRLDDLEY